MNAPHASMMDRFLASDCPVITMPHDSGAFTPLRSPGHRLIVAGNGLYKEVRRAWLHAIVRLAPATTPFGALNQQLCMPFSVPEGLLTDFLEQARLAAPNETAAWIVWNEQTGVLRLLPMQYDQVTPVFLRIQRPVLPEGEHLVIDLHSHHNMSARFSSTDDKDDITSGDVKLAGVVGTIDTRPSWNFRMCLEGILMPDFISYLVKKELP